MKKKGKQVMAVLLLIILSSSILILTLARQPVQGKQKDVLKIVLLKVGKADAIIAQANGKAIVIDAGEEEDGEEIVTYLKNQGLSRIEALIITHYDRDHVGGADTLVEEMEIGEVIIPDYTGSHTEYVDFITALEEKRIVPKKLTQPMEFTFGEATVRTEPPLSYDNTTGAIEMDNNFSLITTITHGHNQLLFMGDAEKQRIRSWLDQENDVACDFIKIPHHGVYNTALRDLLEASEPEYAVICSSNKNPADVPTLELLKQYGVKTYQTKDGNVTVLSDGNMLELKQELEH
ncbi:ComEC/Rec2 family competence protein [Parablautia sp. Marseille-Q6255]|uniref:ComEC/Rec2 family competence protein n=1 Tax=Parablautia sp. Marseille-Q6255 TaxID=3039593 RepID=UPI0024BD2990|nr:MBL fold metallo-hydrolase [Parablautia sp. Marseille-Q6255]